jgi:predicted small lipoprotein YifL
MMRAIQTILAATALLLFCGCARKPASPFPPSNEVAGWTKAEETRSFDAANLWRYIDGDAERYLQAGVEGVSTSDYKLQNGVEAVADVYNMKNADGAQKIYDAEPARSARAVSLGDAARLSGRSLLFRKGRHLVRIVAYDELPEGSQALLELGRGIDRRLVDSGKR